jgi:hypothetical protein
MAGDELDPNAMLGLNLNTPGTTIPTITWEDVAAELNSLHSQMTDLETHTK